jgi:hypothetical protein
VFTREGTTVNTPVTETRPEMAPRHGAFIIPITTTPFSPPPTAKMAQPVVQTIHRDPALLCVAPPYCGKRR